MHAFSVIMPLSPKQNVLSLNTTAGIENVLKPRIGKKEHVCFSPYSIRCGGTSVTSALNLHGKILRNQSVT